jgi:hypothetical protein
MAAVQPFERLRHLARRVGDDATVVTEAADCLAGFGDDPAGLVMACRRLLEHHPSAGSLWWLCARVLTAPDPTEMALESAHVLDEDATADRLASRLPFPHDAPIATLGWTHPTDLTLVQRPDLDVVVVPRRQGDERLGARLRRLERTVRVVRPGELTGVAPSHILVGALGVSPSTAVVPAGTGPLLDGLAARTLVWLVAGAGIVLPERLLDAMRTRIAGDSTVETTALNRFEAVAGPAGLEPPERVARRVNCPVAPELLRPT